MNRRVEIILERYKDDYPKAMGELNVRKNILQKRLDNGAGGRIGRIIKDEINDINKLLIEYSKPINN